MDCRARRSARDAATAKLAGTAARLAKADLTTDMVREFTELQGTMGGIYAREEGLPEEVWKAIYFHYLPIGVEADAPPTRAQLGKAAVTWAAVSLADKLDTIVGLFAAGEKPTGSRDPVRPAPRRAGRRQDPRRSAADIGVQSAVDLKALVDRAFAGYAGALKPEPMPGSPRSRVPGGARAAPVRAARLQSRRSPRGRRRIWRAVRRRRSSASRRWRSARESKEFEALAVLFKRVKNITEGLRRRR